MTQPNPDSDRDDLMLWTIYDRPSDFPHAFVARRTAIKRGGVIEVSSDVIITHDLEGLRRMMNGMGLTCVPRQEADDAVIVEVWM